MFLLLVYLAIAVGVSFLCSILEAVLLSVSSSYVAYLEEKKDKNGPRLRVLKENIDKPLAAILSLNTIAHTVGAAGVGAQAQVVYGNEYLSVTSAVLTFIILVFSEIIPKTIGAVYWKPLSKVVPGILNFMIITLYPLVILSQLLTRLISSDSKKPSFSSAELAAMADQGAKDGIIGQNDSRIFRNLIRLQSLKVRDIMTPRIVVEDFSEHITVKELLEQKKDLPFSRVPVYNKNRDDITGYVLKDEILTYMAQGKADTRLSDIRRPIEIAHHQISVKALFEFLMSKQEHIAMVADEFGGFSGIVTMEDVVETLLGMEIIDEADVIEDMQKMARNRWSERAKRLGIVLPEENEPDEEKEESAENDEKDNSNHSTDKD